MYKLGGGLHLLGANFSSAAPRNRGGSVRLRSRQAGGDPGAGARVGWMAVATGTVSARMSNMKRILSMVNGRRQEKRVPHVRMPDDRHTGLPRPLPQLRRPPRLLRRPVEDPRACAARWGNTIRGRGMKAFRRFSRGSMCHAKGACAACSPRELGVAYTEARYRFSHPGVCQWAPSRCWPSAVSTAEHFLTEKKIP